MKNEGEYVTAKPTSTRLVVKDDEMFHEVAKTAGARCLVTGNKSHFPNEKMVMTPKQFIILYLSENESH
jgi:predicted nucleic acid-binding protein